MSTTPLFITAGLDVRKWPPVNFPSADVTAWDQDEDLYERAQSECGLFENALQLLHANKKSDISKFIDLINANPHSVLVALELTDLVIATYPQAINPIPLPDNLSWETLGYDICDIDGFFSFLNMKVYRNYAMPLFEERQLFEAFSMSEVANICVSDHRPFVLVRVKRLLAR